MKICILFLAAACAFISGRLDGQTLNWGSLAYSDLDDSKGVSLDDSFVFELGTFDPALTPDTSNTDDWFSNWRTFDSAGDDSANGVLTGTAEVGSVTDYSSLFEGLEAYVWVRNSTGPSSDTEWFLARKLATPDSWVFPDLDPGCCPTGDVTEWSVSDLGGETPVWRNQGGNLGGGDFDVTGPYDLQTHVVPEPGACLLGLMGVGMAVLRRHRGK